MPLYHLRCPECGYICDVSVREIKCGRCILERNVQIDMVPMTAVDLHNLQVAVRACAETVEMLSRDSDDQRYALKRITQPVGREGFRFMTTLTIEGREVEVQVRTK